MEVEIIPGITVAPHYKGRDGSCRRNAGALATPDGIALAGSRRLVAEWAPRIFPQGQTRRVIEFVCPECGEKGKIIISLSAGGGLIRFKVV